MDLLRARVRINGKETLALIDSGATMNLILEKWAKSHGLPITIKYYPYKLRVVDGTLISQEAGEV